MRGATKAARQNARVDDLAEKRKQRKFFNLAGRFRSASKPEELKRLGNQMGRMIFGN